MQFRTPVAVDRPEQGLLHHAGRYMLLGSCFANEIGSRLGRDGFEVTVNPGGTLYNPLSILGWVKRMVAETPFTSDDIVAGPDDFYHTWMHHTTMSRPTPDETLDLANRTLVQGAQALRDCRVLFITLGTNRVFELAETGRVVSNCHKHHPATFNERRIGIDETVEALHEISRNVHDVNPQTEIIWTVSPVRHPGQGGLHANALAKATLLLAVDTIGGRYFPAYEALVDDLRDYRFCAADMRHPSEVAADYVYSLLLDAYATPDTVNRAMECRRISRRRNHRPIKE